MSVNFNGISPNSYVSYVKDCSCPECRNEIPAEALGGLKEDTFELQSQKSELTTEDKQQKMKSARKSGSGWSILFGPFASAYFALRSNDTVAKKFNLDPVKDKDLVQQIKKAQTMWSLPGIFGLGIPAFLVSNVLPSKDINVD